MWAHGERYNDDGEWNPRLIYDEDSGEYMEPEDMPTVNDKPIRLTPLGNIVVVLGIFIVLAIAGWIEGL